MVVVQENNSDWCVGMKKKISQKQQIVLVIGLVCCLTILLLFQDIRAGRAAVKDGILRGDGDEIYQETFVLEQENGQKQNVNITVYPRQLSEKEKQKLLQQAVTEFEARYLGTNVSADQVSSALVFAADYCQGQVAAVYNSDRPDLIWEDGSVETEEVGTDGELVTVEVSFDCQGTALDYICHVKVVPPVMPEETKERQRLETLVQQWEASSREDACFVLPDTLDGQSVQWRKQVSMEPFGLLLLGAVAVLALLQKGKQEEKKQRQGRERQLLLEYPQMVTQLSLLLGAGMHLSTAWERMVKRYLSQQVQQEENEKAGSRLRAKKAKKMYLEEMLLTYRDLKDGVNIRVAYEDFAERIRLTPYRKLTALLIQNMDKGNRDLIRLLDMEAEMAIEEQRKQVRRLGEEAGTKLLFPMLLLFVLILIVIMVPALQSF